MTTTASSENQVTVKSIKKTAANVRINIINMLAAAGSGHPGGSLSLTDLITTLYMYNLKHDPKNSKMEDRDRVVLSKGHAAPALYSILAEMGYFDKKELNSLRKYGAMLQGHPDMKLTPGVDMSTGSLGQGFSASVGMALGAKLDKKDYRLYVFLGDGEMQEGQVWEAAMAASHYKLDNMCAVLDMNKLQIDGNVCDVMNVYPLVEKWQAFGWNVIKIDGHDIEQIMQAYDNAASFKGKPTIILADTIKGKDVSFMEGKASYHGVAPTKEEQVKALEEINSILNQVK